MLQILYFKINTKTNKEEDRSLEVGIIIYINVLIFYNNNLIDSKVKILNATLFS